MNLKISKLWAYQSIWVHLGLSGSIQTLASHQPTHFHFHYQNTAHDHPHLNPIALNPKRIQENAWQLRVL